MELVGILLLIAILAMLSDSVEAGSEDDRPWDNISNITDLSPVNGLQVNSNRDSVFILMGNSLEEWSLEQPTRYVKYSPAWGDVYDLHWSDHMNMMAILHTGSPYDIPSVWDSKLVILNENMDIVESLVPWGNLTGYPGSEMIDLEWDPTSSRLAILHDDGVLRIVDVIELTLVLQRDLGSNAAHIRWNPSGTLLSYQIDEMVDEINLLDPDLNTTWELNRIPVLIDYGWSHDGQFIYAMRSSVINAINISSGTSEELWEGIGVGMATSPTESLIAISETDAISFMDYPSGERVTYHQRKPPTGLSQWTNDGVYFVHMDETDIVHVWTRRTLPVRPTVSIDSPLEGIQASGELNVSGSAWSSHQEHAYVVVRVGDSEWTLVQGFEEWYHQFDSRTVQDGRLTIRAKAVDPNGSSNIAVVTISIKNGAGTENSRPTVSIISPTDDQRVWGVVKISGTAIDDNSVLSVQLKVGTNLWSDVEISGSGTAVTWVHYIELYVEVNNLEISARSYDGTLFSETWTVIIDAIEIDNLDPVIDVRILYPSSGMETPPDLNVSGIVLDGVADQVLVRFGSGTIHPAFGTETWYFPVNGLSKGVHSVGAMAFNDTYQSTWTFVTFYVKDDVEIQNRKPDVGIIRPLNGSLVKDEFVMEGWSSDDNRVVHLELRVDDGDWLSAEGTQKWKRLITVDEGVEGWIEIEIRAYDGELYSDILSVSYFHSPSEVTEPQYSNFVLYIIIIILVFIILNLYIYHRRRMRNQTD